MKFSVLLPTRNRLEYLKYALQSVVRQDYDNWEIVVSDNFSEEDVCQYVRLIADPRIKYFRTDSFVSATDNWNNALEHSSGDYVIMLGDDDCLMKGYFTGMHRLIEEYAQPEAIYTSAFLFSYPGVMPGFPEGFLHLAGCARFLNQGDRRPFWLNREHALELVRHSMNFRLRFDYNMQYATISRSFIDSLCDKGAFFQSPFPDFYSMNVMFLKAERILVYPHPMVTIGITPKSYGFFHFNQRETEGIEFLKNSPDPQSLRRLQRVLLPGTNMNTGWLFAMESIKTNYGPEFSLRVNYCHYRLLQIIHVHNRYYVGGILSRQEFNELKRLMPWWENVLFTMIGLIPRRLSKWLADVLTVRRLKQYPAVAPPKGERTYRNILEVFEQVNPLQDSLATRR